MSDESTAAPSQLSPRAALDALQSVDVIAADAAHLLGGLQAQLQNVRVSRRIHHASSCQHVLFLVPPPRRLLTARPST